MTNLNVCYTDYDYDAAGNRIYANYSSAGGDYEIDYTYDKNNRLIKGRQYGEGSENNRITTYGYDKNGNRISKKYYNNYPYSSQKTILKIEDYRSKLTTDAESYIYDGFNRLTQISTEGDNVYKYAYYPNGLRMYKDVNGAMTYFQWDGDNIWGLAANVSNGLTHYYYRGLDGVIKENYGAVYVYNGHGDVVKVTNSNGDVTKDYEYNAFGVIEDENAADINPWRYCGEYYDAETGNIYLRARYYDPSIGSFITEDPARDGTNWYSYCAGNPVSYIDPSGLDAMLDDYIAQNYKNKITITIAVKRPVPNSREVATVKDGKIDNGHTFLRIDDGNGNVKYWGFAPKEINLRSMLMSNDTLGEFVDDSSTEWNVAKVYVISRRQYDNILEYKNNYNIEYNLEKNNCTTFAVNTLKNNGINIDTYEQKWMLPYNLDDLIPQYQAIPDIVPSIVTKSLIVSSMGNNYGFTPSNTAQDLKEMPGKVLLNYGKGLQEINVSSTKKEFPTEPIA